MGSTLDALWADNEESMLAYLESVHIGVRGVITDRATGAPLRAQVRVDGNTHPVFTDANVGDYHRMLLPGRYTLIYSAPGYATRTLHNIDVGADEAVRADVRLARGDINGDGKIDAVDVQLVIDAVLGMSVPYDCDLDGGGVSSTDVQIVVNAVLGI